MISVILVEPRNSGNVGAVARAMANFGFSSLVLVNPKCNHLSQAARNRAKWAQDVLKNAKVVKRLPKMDVLVATTGKVGTEYNISRCAVTPCQLAEMIPAAANAGIVFGRESHGLTNEEISECDFSASIPSSKKYPVLNLSHAAAVILYELAKKRESILSHIQPAARQDKEQVMKLLKQAMSKMDFSTPEKKKTQVLVWKKMVSKSFLTKREAFALMGFLRKLV